MADEHQASTSMNVNVTNVSGSIQGSEDSFTANAEIPQSDPNAESNEPSHPVAEILFEHTDEIGEDSEEHAASLQETAESVSARDISITENCLELTTPGPNSVTDCQKSSEAVASYEEKVSWNKILLSLLECPVCFNYMVPPITLCRSGHNICNACSPFMSLCPICRQCSLETRNISLEKIARELELPCKNPGCTDCNNHLSTCIFQPINPCPFEHFTDCVWQGNLADIKNHMEAKHADKILYNIHTHDWPLRFVMKDFKIIFSLGEIFLYTLKLHVNKRRFYIQVFYIGPYHNHRNFMYTVLVHSKLMNQRMSFYNTVLSMDDLKLQSPYTSGNCTVLQYSQVARLSVKGDIEYWLKLGKKEEV